MVTEARANSRPEAKPNAMKIYPTRSEFEREEFVIDKLSEERPFKRRCVRYM